jgi:hypothetical protein
LLVAAKVKEKKKKRPNKQTNLLTNETIAMEKGNEVQKIDL